MPLISVIIPIYNGRDTLAAAVESVLAQTLSDYEIILIDDASTDGSYDLCAEYAAADKRISVIRNGHNSFVGFSRNRGIEKASGEYIYFLDCDDILYSKEVFQKAMDIGAAACEGGADIIASLVRLESGGKRKNGKIRSAADLFIFSPYLSQSFYKKSIIYRLFSIERKTAEDCEWLFYNLPSAQSIAVAPFPFYVYTRGREGSLTTRMKKEYIAPTVDTFIGMYRGENPFPKRDRRRVQRYCADALISHALLANHYGMDDVVKMCVPYLKKSKAAPFIALSRVTGLDAAFKLINLKMKIY